MRSMLNYMDNVQKAGAGLDAATNGKPDSEAADQNGKTDLKFLVFRQWKLQQARPYRDKSL